MCHPRARASSPMFADSIASSCAVEAGDAARARYLAQGHGPASPPHRLQRAALGESTADPDPFRQFERWFNEALAFGLREPYAMALATADARGRPAVRMVLLREWDHRGFAFFTNHESRKAPELVENPQASLLFFWSELERCRSVSRAVPRSSTPQSPTPTTVAAPRIAHRRLGFATEPGDVADRAELRAARRGVSRAARGRRPAAPTALGRCSGRARGDRVLAGPLRACTTDCVIGSSVKAGRATASPREARGDGCATASPREGTPHPRDERRRCIQLSRTMT